MAEHGRARLHPEATTAHCSEGAADPGQARAAAAMARPTAWITMSDHICQQCTVRYLPLRGPCICVSPPW